MTYIVHFSRFKSENSNVLSLPISYTLQHAAADQNPTSFSLKSEKSQL